MAGVNLSKFADFLEEVDPSSDVSPVMHFENGEILLSTAYTKEKELGKGYGER